jgi:hypothetical protein
VKTGKGVGQGCCLSLILFNPYSEYLTKKALEGFEDLKIGGKVSCIVKYADDLVLLAMEENGTTGHN